MAGGEFQTPPKGIRLADSTKPGAATASVDQRATPSPIGEMDMKGDNDLISGDEILVLLDQAPPKVGRVAA